MTAPGGEVPAFLHRLRARFEGRRPQGSDAWNFGAAFTGLERAWGPPPPPGPLSTAAGDGPPAPQRATPDTTTVPAGRSVGNRLLHRYVLSRLGPWIDGRAARAAGEAATAALEAGHDRVQEGFSHALEAFRFLSARVEALERAAALRVEPLAGMPWLTADASDVLADEVAEALAEHPPAGPVLHLECGSGALLAALRRAGLDARGADPRGALALEAALHDLDADTADAATVLGALDPGACPALVLGGVVDRLPIEALCQLLALATSRLAPGAPLVVVSGGLDAVSGLPPAARDLLPGHPLHPETWELLLRRAGFTDLRRLVHRGRGTGGDHLAGAGGEPGGQGGGPYAVVGSGPS